MTDGEHVRVVWRPGLGSCPGGVELVKVDRCGRVQCVKPTSFPEAATLMAAIGMLTGDYRPAEDLLTLQQIAKKAKGL